MKLKTLSLVSALALFAGTVACEKSSPARPSDSTGASGSAAVSGGAAVTDAVTGITLTAPTLTSPTANQSFKFADQPLTLTLKNAVHTAGAAATPTYTFEVATDAAFANKVYTKDGVAEGAGSTALKIDTLAGPLAKNYFWHARAAIGAVVSPFTAARGFSVGAQVTITAPVAASPSAGGTVGSNGILAVTNATTTGPAGAVSYRFEVSDSSAFTNLVFTSTVGQGSGQTSVNMTANLTANGTYFWRVIVSDPATQVSSPYSATSTFKFVPFSMKDATIVDSPGDLGSWPETAAITSVQFQGGGPFLVDFDRRDGQGRWPDMPFGSGDLEYTLGLCVNISGHWYCSAVVQFWYGRSLDSSGNASDVGFEWFYDPARWRAPLTGYQPQPGETVGVFVASGNLRDGSYTQASCPGVCERSNVAFVQWEGNGFNGASALRLKR